MVFAGFTIGYRRRIFKLRKAYDHARERADKKPLRERMAILKVLDHVEPILIMLEEQKVSRFQRGGMIRQVRMAIGQAKEMLKEEYVPEPAYTQYRKRRY